MSSEHCPGPHCPFVLRSHSQDEVIPKGKFKMKAATCEIKMIMFFMDTTLKWILCEDLRMVVHQSLHPWSALGSAFLSWISIPITHRAPSLGQVTVGVTSDLKLLFERLEFPKVWKFLFETNPYYLVCTCSS